MQVIGVYHVFVNEMRWDELRWVEGRWETETMNIDEDIYAQCYWINWEEDDDYIHDNTCHNITRHNVI